MNETLNTRASWIVVHQASESFEIVRRSGGGTNEVRQEQTDIREIGTDKLSKANGNWSAKNPEYLVLVEQWVENIECFRYYQRDVFQFCQF
jgi:hypothetical protein